MVSRPQVAVGLADIGAAARAVPAVRPAASGDLVLPHHADRQPVGDESPVDADGEHRRLDGRQGVQLGDRVPDLSQQPGDPFGGGVAVHGDHHVDPSLLPPGDGRTDRGGVADHGVEPAHRVGVLAGPCRRRRRRQVGTGGERGVEWEVQQRVLTGRRGALSPGAGQGGGEVLLLAAQLGGAGDRLCRVEHHQPRLGGLVDHRPLRRQPGQPTLQPGEGHAGGDPVPGRRRPRLGDEQPAGGGDHSGVRHHLPGGVGGDRAHRLPGPLVARGESADVGDLVPPELDPVGRVALGGEQVDDPAPGGDFPAALHPVGAGVADGDQVVHHPVEVGLVADGQRHRRHPARADPLYGRPHRRHHHGCLDGVAGRLEQAVSGLGSGRHRAHVRGDVLEGQRSPGREQQRPLDEQGKVVDQVLGLVLAGHDRQDRAGVGYAPATPGAAPGATGAPPPFPGCRGGGRRATTGPGSTGGLQASVGN